MVNQNHQKMETVWITSSGKSAPTKPENGSDFTLEELQGYVGGYIELVYLRDGRIMVVNEEGKIEGLPPNQIATEIYGNPNDYVVGNVLVTDPKFIK